MFFLTIAEGSEVHTLTFFYLHNVSFRDFRFHRHGVELGQFDNDWCTLVGVYGLTFFRNDSHDRTIHRGNNTGIA